MKTLALLLLTIGLTCSVHAQNLHDWHVKFNVMDETGQPIQGAKATVYFDAPPEITNNISGLTDANGVFAAAHRDYTFGLRFRIEKDGYYVTDYSQDFLGVFSDANLNRDLHVTLKKIGKPIAMYAKLVDENPPTLDQPIGYDLMVGDWVCSGHKGISADIIFQKWAYRKSGSDYEYKVKITFPKDGDGIQIYNLPDSEKGSSLRSPHEAALNGYLPELDKERSAHPGQPTKNDYDSNRIYLFRVRTVKDHEGNVVSAHYGKIYGDFMQFIYYLNPTPNDQNIEFDPKQNLLGGLDPLDQVTAP